MFTSRRSTVQRIVAGAGALALTSFGLVALGAPATAADGDLSIDKDNDVSGDVVDGQTINFVVEVNNNSAVNTINDIDVWDDPDDTLDYVPESTVATVYTPGTSAAADDFASNLYTGGTGAWTSNWVETNDDGSSSTTTGDVYTNNNVLRFGAQTFPNAYLERTVNTTDATTFDLEFDAASWTNTLEADDILTITVTGDGGTATRNLLGTELAGFVADAAGGWNDDGTAITVDGSAALPSASVTIRFEVTSGTDAGTGTDREQFFISFLTVDMDTLAVDIYDNIPGGANTDLVEGEAGNLSSLIAPGDSIDLAPLAWVVITYQMVVDADGEGGNYYYADNDVYVLSADDTSQPGDFTENDIDRAPVLSFAITSNAPLELGEDLVLTIVVQHDPSSDGATVCDVVFDSDTSIGEATYVSGDTGLDGCLEDGEVWTFTLTFASGSPEVPAAVGDYGFDVGAFGEEVDGDDYGNADTFEFSIVLAATGATSTGLVAWAVGLLALGAGALMVARRRA